MNNETSLFEIKRMIMEMRTIINTLFPEKISISFIVERTGLTRQGVRERLISNYAIEEDFWKEGGKLFMTKTVALQFLGIGDNKNGK